MLRFDLPLAAFAIALTAAAVASTHAEPAAEAQVEELDFSEMGGLEITVGPEAVHCLLGDQETVSTPTVPRIEYRDLDFEGFALEVTPNGSCLRTPGQLSDCGQLADRGARLEVDAGLPVDRI